MDYDEPVDVDFSSIFQEEVLRELNRKDGDFLQRFPLRLFLTSEDQDLICRLVRDCELKLTSTPQDFSEWFTLAYSAGLVHSCRHINGVIYFRTEEGYEQWADLIKVYPLDELREKIQQRKEYLNKLMSTNKEADQDIASFRVSMISDLMQQPIIWPRKVATTQPQKIVNEIVSNKNILKLLCPALKTASNDTFEIAKITTPILLSLALAGTINLPLIPVIFAGIAVAIGRLGISTICADYNDNKSS